MASDSVTCAACGARNRVKWEFCARCGEALQGAAAGSASTLVPGQTLGRTPGKPASKAAAKLAGKKGIKVQVSERPSNNTGNWIALVAILAAGVAAFAYVRRIPLPVAAAAPNILGGPSLPPPARVEDPGNNKGTAFFREGKRLAGEGKHEEALEQFRLAIAAVPDKALYHAALAESLEKLERVDESLRALADAAQLRRHY